jgi:hypothetical protein
MARPTGGTLHPDPLAGRVRVRRMSGSAERRRQARFRRRAQGQLPDAIHPGQAFRTALRELRLTPNRLWGLKECRE